MQSALHHFSGLSCQPPRLPSLLQSHHRPQVTCRAQQRRNKRKNYDDSDSWEAQSKAPGSSLDLNVPWWQDTSTDSSPSTSSGSNGWDEPPMPRRADDEGRERQQVRSRERSNGSSGSQRGTRGDVSSSRNSSSDGSSRPSSSSSGRGGGSTSSAGRDQHARSRQRFADAFDHGGYDDDDSDEDEEGPGWWEVPREQRNAPVAAPRYEDWQLEKLEVAFLRGKRRVQVQALAAELDLDRVEVLDWFKSFAALPAAERNRRLKPRQPLLEQQLQQEQQQKEREEKRAQKRAQERQEQQQQQQQQLQQQQGVAGMPGVSSWSQQELLSRQAGPNTGFIPFYDRKDAAASGKAHKRLSAEAMRTLEAVYARTPYPPRDVVQGLYELHRINRDAAMEWFTARREADGRPHNPRAAKRAAEAAGSSGWEPSSAPAGADNSSNADIARRELLALFGGEGSVLPAAAGADSAPAKRTVVLTQRELTQLRSSLPSPNKRKGIKLAEQLSIKQGEAPGQMEVGGITFVAQDGAQRWRGVWRRRRAKKGLPANFLDYRRWLNNLSAQHRQATLQQAPGASELQQ